MAKILPNGKQQYFDSNGDPLSGGFVYTYESGTTTPKTTYSNSAGTIANANPVVLDSRGEATIFWNGTYTVTVKDSLGNTIYTVDGITTLSTGADVSYASTTLDAIFASNSVYAVETIADLGAVDSTKWSYCFVSGYYAAGDGGGGLYYHDAGDTTSFDNGGTIIVAADTARWKLHLFGNPVSLQQFGAKSDGATDCSAALQAAADWVATSDNKTILVSGQFYVGSSVQILENIRFQGQHNGIITDTNAQTDYPTVMVLADGVLLTTNAIYDGILFLSTVTSDIGAHPLPIKLDGTAVAAYAGYGCIGGGAGNAGNNKFLNCSFIGFDYPINGFSQIDNVSIDCTAGLRNTGGQLYIPINLLRFGDLACGATGARGGLLLEDALASGTTYAFTNCDAQYHRGISVDGGYVKIQSSNIMTYGAYDTITIANGDVSLDNSTFSKQNGAANYDLNIDSGCDYFADNCTISKIYLKSGAGRGVITGNDQDVAITAATAADAVKCVIGYRKHAWTPQTFTPTLKFGGATTGITYAADGQKGYYFVQENIVHYQIRLELTSNGSATGAATITGLPYTSSASTNCIGGSAVNFYNNFATVSGCTATVPASGTTIYLYDNGGTNSTALTDTDITDTAIIVITGSYFIDR